jgi:hypothetical protein
MGLASMWALAPLLFKEWRVTWTFSYTQYPYIVWKYIIYLQIGRQASLFRNECKLILYLTTMYVYCVYPAISKGSNQLQYWSENSWNKRRSKSFQRRHMWRHRLYCYCFFLLLNRNQEPEKLDCGHLKYIQSMQFNCLNRTCAG